MSQESVDRLLGELIAKVENLREDMKESERKSDISRAGVHRRLDDMVDRVGDVEGDVKEIRKDVSEMKPVTDDVKRWRLIGLGALGVIGIAGTALGVTFADVVKRAFTILTGGKI